MCKVEYHFLKVGHGDCSIIRLPSGKTFMVDCHDPQQSGLESSREYLKKNFSDIGNTIDYIVITHPHKDHWDGLYGLTREGYFWVKEIWDSQYMLQGDGRVDEEEYKKYQKLLGTLKEVDTNIRYPKASSTPIQLDEQSKVYVLSPTGNPDTPNKDIHDSSMVLLLEMNGLKTILFAGDARDRQWDRITKYYPNILEKTDILHASHHGSLDGAHLDAIKIMTGNDVIISAKYGDLDHPNSTARGRYSQYFENIKTTKNKTIVYKQR